MKAMRDRRVRAIAALVCAYSSTISAASARDESNAHRGMGRLNLDLSSTKESVQMTRRLANTINIQVGDTIRTVSAGDQLTPAQAIAAYQVMRNNTQTLVLGAGGNAVGGSVELNQNVQRHITGMTVPENVTVVSDVARNGIVNFRDDFVNSGTYRAISTNPKFDTATMIADNILNNQGALIAAQGTNEVQALNLDLIARNNLVNAGTISSTGNLNLTAGASLTNALPAGTTGGAPAISALRDININAANLINNSMISSQLGNISIASRIASQAGSSVNVLNVDNTGGVIDAANGAINVGTLGSDTNIGMLGGDWLSKELNVNAGSGEIAASVGKVSGVLHSSAGVEHFSADADVLVLGNNCITGDPTFANTGAILVSGTVTVNEALAIIAGSDIVGTADAQIINTSNADTYLIAGATITSGSLSGGTLNSSTSPVATPVDIQFTNSNTGTIDFRLSQPAGAVVSTNGGALFMFANSNGTGSGNIWFNELTTISTASSSGAGGRITVFAGGEGGTGGAPSESIFLGNILTTSSTSSAGNVTMVTANPLQSNGTTATFQTNGTTSATFGTGTNNPNGSISAGNLDLVGGNAFILGLSGSAGGSVNLQAGDSMNIGDITTTGGNGAVGVSGIISGSGGAGGSGGASGSINLSAPEIEVDQISAVGGAGGDGGTAGPSGGVGGQGGNGGNAGSVVINAQQLVMSQVNLSGGAGGQAGNSPASHGGSGGAGGSGGSLTLNISDDEFISATPLTLNGGNGGNGSSAGSGNFNGGAGGAGGNAGTLTILAKGSINPAAGISQTGGNGGAGGAQSGSGTNGADGSDGLNGFLNLSSLEGDIGSPTNGYLQSDARLATLSAPNGFVGVQFSGDVTLTGINSGLSYGLAAPKITFDSPTSLPATPQLTLETFSGELVLPSSTLSVLPQAGVGGRISINSGTISWAGSGTDPLTLSANGTAFGGLVDLALSTGDITLGTTAGLFRIDAFGESGGTARVSSTSDVIINDNFALNVAPQDSNGNGGSIIIDAHMITSPTPGPIIFEQSAGLGSGNGGQVILSISPSSPVTVGANGQFRVNASGASGGEVRILTNNQLTIENGGINVEANGLNGNGGTIRLEFSQLVLGPDTVTLDLSANPTGTGKGGTFVASTISTAPIVFGADGGLQVIANGGTAGGGGVVELHTRGDILVNDGGISVLAGKKGGDGGRITLEAGRFFSGQIGRLLINGDLDVSSKKGTAGQIQISTNSTADFAIGGATSNGITGSFKTKGKTDSALVSITNTTSGITVNESLTAARQITLRSDGNITIGASLGSKTTDGLSLATDTDIVVTSSSAKLVSDMLVIRGQHVSNSQGGAINVDVASIDVEGDDISINNKRSFVISNALINQSLNLITKGTIETADPPTTVVDAPLLLLNAKKGVGIANSIRVNANDLAITSGGKGTVKIANASANIRLLDSSFGGLELSSPGDIDVIGDIGSSKADVAITISSGSLSSSVGSITAANFEFGIQGAVGSLVSPLIANATHIEGGAFSVAISTSAKSTTIGNMQTVGNIAIVATPATKSLNIENDVLILANNGAMAFQNQNQKGSINIGAGADISTLGGGGDIAFYVGDIPGAPDVGTAPANVQVTGSGGTVFFGRAGITADAPDNILTVKNADIIFSTGTASAKAINLGGGVNILADPPVRGGGASIDYSQLHALHTVLGESAPHTENSSSALPAVNDYSLDAVASTRLGTITGDTLNSDALVGAISSKMNVIADDLRLNFISSGAANPKSDSTNHLTTSMRTEEDTQMSTAAISSYLTSMHNNALAEIEFEPGAFSTHVMADDRLDIAADTQAAHLTHKGERLVQLHKGRLLVAPKTPLTIETNAGEISVEEGSVVLVIATKSSVSVYDIDDCKRGSVKINSNNRHITLSPGRHAVITSLKADSFDTVNPAECFTYRNLNSMQVTDELKAFTGEFSIPSAINAVTQLKHLVNSKHARSNQVRDHLMKTTAVLLHMQGAGRYEQFVRPRVAAYNAQ